MVIDNHDCSCGSGCSRVGQFHQHAQPNWVDHCSCMPRGSGDLLHRQQADFLNMPRSSARRDSTFQQPGPARPVCFTVIDVLSSRCAAAPLRPAPLRCCAAPPLHPVWISCPRRGISFLWRRTPIGSLPARDFLHRLTDSILAPQELARVRPTPPPPPFLVHSLSDPCAGRSPSPPPSGCCAQRASSAAATTSSKRACTEAAASGNGDSSLASSM
jgi:hypothetical protein